MSNEFEERARARKVTALMSVIDQIATEQGMKPHGDSDEVDAVLEIVAAFGNDVWLKLSRQARLKNPPSERTIALVLAAYQQRAEIADEDPFARMG